MKRMHQLVGHTVLLRLIEENALGRLTADVDILRDRQILHQVQLLMDDTDSLGLRVARAVDLDGRAEQLDRALILCIDAGEDLHERGLSGSVFSDQRHDLARADLKLRVVECVNAREILLDPIHSENRFSHLSATFPFPYRTRNAQNKSLRARSFILYF